MDIKSKAYILKKRSKELGYDIKLTHAQEIVSALYGHKSRHSALLEEDKPVGSVEDETETVKIEPQEENLEFYGIKSFPEDDFELSEKVFDIGLKIGHKHGKELSDKLDKLYKESMPLHTNLMRGRIFNASLRHGILKALTIKLDIFPLRSYFKDLEKESYVSKAGGRNMVQKVLRKKTKDLWANLTKNK